MKDFKPEDIEVKAKYTHPDHRRAKYTGIVINGANKTKGLLVRMRNGEYHTVRPPNDQVLQLWWNKFIKIS